MLIKINIQYDNNIWIIWSKNRDKSENINDCPLYVQWVIHNWQMK